MGECEKRGPPVLQHSRTELGTSATITAATERTSASKATMANNNAGRGAEGPFEAAGRSSSLSQRPSAGSAAAPSGYAPHAASSNTVSNSPPGAAALNFRPIAQQQQPSQQPQRPLQSLAAGGVPQPMHQPMVQGYIDGRAQQTFHSAQGAYHQHMGEGLRYGSYVLADQAAQHSLFANPDDYFNGARAYVEGSRQGQAAAYSTNPMQTRMGFDNGTSPTVPNVDFFAMDGLLELPDPWGLEQSVYGGAPVQSHTRRVNVPGHSAEPGYQFSRMGLNHPSPNQFVTYDATRLPQGRAETMVPPPSRPWMNPNELNRQMYWPAPNAATTATPSNSINGNGQRALAKRPSSSSQAVHSAEKKRTKSQQGANAGPMPGESRLKVAFTGIGVPGSEPQRFGTKGYVIPDGLCGSHQVYHQKWQFETRHSRSEDGIIVVTWSITALATGSVTSRTETSREAQVRQTSGHTICNQVLRAALKARATELEATAPQFQDNPQKLEALQGLIKALQPKSCILGLLFFGLLHTNVQQRMCELMEANGRGASAAVDAASLPVRYSDWSSPDEVNVVAAAASEEGSFETGSSAEH